MSDNDIRTVGTCEGVTSCRDRLEGSFGEHEVLFGFDGVIDTVREMVAQRHSADEITPIRELASLGERINDSVATETSLAIEWLNRGTRTGGHVCHLSRVFGEWGFDPVMIGTFGSPIAPEFEAEFDAYTTHSVGAPGTTDAIEFNDGKLMLTEAGEYRTLDWDTITDRLGHETLARHLEAADLFGMGYWANTPDLPGIIDGLLDDVWPTLSQPPAHVLFDPADIRQLPGSQLQAGFSSIRRLNDRVPVTLSANRAETEALIESDRDVSGTPSMLELAATARDVVGVDRVVSHSADCAAMVTDDGRASVETLHVEEPEIVTSSGDHFNAGICLGLLEGLDVGAMTALGNVVAGVFVRTGESPTLEELRTFAADYREHVCDQ